jgi:hypothetical protein
VASKVLYCSESHIQLDGSCSSPVWLDPPSLLPPLSIADAQGLLLAWLGVLTIAFGARMVAQFLLTSGANRN